MILVGWVPKTLKLINSLQRVIVYFMLINPYLHCVKLFIGIRFEYETYYKMYFQFNKYWWLLNNIEYSLHTAIFYYHTDIYDFYHLCYRCSKKKFLFYNRRKNLYCSGWASKRSQKKDGKVINLTSINLKIKPLWRHTNERRTPYTMLYLY